MGYFITSYEIDVKISVSKADAALIEMKRINGPEFDQYKCGGDGQRVKWYSWMPESFDEFKTIDEFLECVGFEGTKRDSDFVTLGHYDKKTGSEDVFMHFLAPFIEAGSFINWRGEDGGMWRWEFDGTTVERKTAQTLWV